MKKKQIISAVIVLLIVVSFISLYATFAYDEETEALSESTADYNLVYSLKNKSNQIINVSAKEEKYVEITLNNTYDVQVKYGMYYYLNTPNKLPSGVTIELAKNSPSKLEDIIKSRESKTIIIRIKNDTDYSLDLVIGALVGFENGSIEDLVSDGEVLIK